MKKVSVGILIVLFSHSGISQTIKEDYTDALNVLEVWLEAQKDYDKLPGLSAIVASDQDVLWKGGFGMANIDESVEVKPSTLFSICSISKLFTSIAIMNLYEEGKLKIDDHIHDVLPWYNLSQKFPDSPPITIQSLLTHSSGIPREAPFSYWTDPKHVFPTEDQVKDNLAKQETLYPSSVYYQYSNLGLTLLGYIVEEITGMSYEQYIQQTILEPLNLINTRTELPKALYGSQLAIGYSAITRYGERKKVNFLQAQGLTPAAGYSSNVEDLGKFASWQFRLLESDTEEVLKPSTLKNMHQVHWVDADWKTTRGLGFVVKQDQNGTTEIGHGGTCPGYRSLFSLYPASKKAVVVMMNATDGDRQKYVDGILDIIQKFEKGMDKAPYNEESQDFKEYTGYYNLQQPRWGERYIATWHSNLVVLTLPTDSPTKSMIFYKHILGDEFKRIRNDGEFGEKLVFERGPEGQVSGFETFEKRWLKTNQ